MSTFPDDRCEDCGAIINREYCGVCPDCYERRRPRPLCHCGDRLCSRPFRCGYVLVDGELRPYTPIGEAKKQEVVPSGG